MPEPPGDKTTSTGRRSHARTVAAICLAGLVIAFLVAPTAIGCGSVPVAVRVRLVDASSGAPLRDAVVSVVGYDKSLQSPHFAESVRESLEYKDNDNPESGRYFNVSSRRAEGQASMTIHSRALTSGRIIAGIEISSSFVLPDLLVIDHGRYGRMVVRIDEDHAVAKVEGERRYTLDLGTIRVGPESRPPR